MAGSNGLAIFTQILGMGITFFRNYAQGSAIQFQNDLAANIKRADQDYREHLQKLNDEICIAQHSYETNPTLQAAQDFFLALMKAKSYFEAERKHLIKNKRTHTIDYRIAEKNIAQLNPYLKEVKEYIDAKNPIALKSHPIVGYSNMNEDYQDNILDLNDYSSHEHLFRSEFNNKEIINLVSSSGFNLSQVEKSTLQQDFLNLFKQTWLSTYSPHNGYSYAGSLQRTALREAVRTRVRFLFKKNNKTNIGPNSSPEEHAITFPIPTIAEVKNIHTTILLHECWHIYQSIKYSVADSSGRNQVDYVTLNHFENETYYDPISTDPNRSVLRPVFPFYPANFENFNIFREFLAEIKINAELYKYFLTSSSIELTSEQVAALERYHVGIEFYSQNGHQGLLTGLEAYLIDYSPPQEPHEKLIYDLDYFDNAYAKTPFDKLQSEDGLLILDRQHTIETDAHYMNLRPEFLDAFAPSLIRHHLISHDDFLERCQNNNNATPQFMHCPDNMNDEEDTGAGMGRYQR